MDDRLTAALNFSNFRQAFSTQQRILKEKSEAKLTYGYNSGIFKIDKELISFVKALLDFGRQSNVVILDQNNNPILIEDLIKFQDEIMDRYFTVTNEYFDSMQKLKKSRSLEKLLDL
jgi:hypothetical protein